jgi:hypothetical protein
MHESLLEATRLNDRGPRGIKHLVRDILGKKHLLSSARPASPFSISRPLSAAARNILASDDDLTMRQSTCANHMEHAIQKKSVILRGSRPTTTFRRQSCEMTRPLRLAQIASRQSRLGEARLLDFGSSRLHLRGVFFQAGALE